jgi:tetratricopeptide (TPR) repeat protein
LSAAMDHLHQARAIYQALTSEQPTNVQFRRAMLSVYSLMARVSGDSSTLNLGDTAGAVAFRRQSLAIAEELAAADPKNVLARNDLNYEYRILGILLSETNPAEAVGMLNKALEAETSALAPGKQLSSGYKVNYHTDIALPLLKMGDREGARQHISQAQELFRAIPSNSQSMMSVVGPDLQMAIGDLQLALGDSTGALENYRQALLLLEAQVPAAPFNMHGRSLLAGCYHRLGRLYAALASQVGQTNAPSVQQIEHWRTACTWYQKDLRIWNEWTKWGVSSAYDKTKREQAARALAQCQAMLEKLGASAQRRNHRAPA